MSYTDPEKQRAYARAWIAKRRRAFFVDKACCLCDSKVSLELDHIDPKTKISHAIWSWRQERREAEIAKCQILCEKCHANKTAAENSARRKDQPNHTARKLGIQAVEEIRASELSKRALAHLYGVGATTIQSIRSRALYKN